jgi:hypothetical protein
MNDHEQNIEIMKDLRGRLDAVINKGTTAHPDARKHRNISFVKSFFRILAGGILCTGEFFIAGSLLVLAEMLGVIEELV